MELQRSLEQQNANYWRNDNLKPHWSFLE